MDGKQVAEKIKIDLKKRVDFLKSHEVTPKLVILQVGDDKRSTTYIRAKKKSGEEVGVDVEIKTFNGDVKEDQIKKTIKQINRDSSVHGIIVQLPLPEGFDADEIIDEINPKKDVDGLTSVNQAALEMGRELRLPATPLGIVTLLDHYKVPINGSSIALIGRGRLVGKPLRYMLENRGAQVLVGHLETPDISVLTKQADIVVAAAGHPNLITADMVKNDAVLIDVGLTDVDDRLVGDITDEAKQKAKLATPVPGGVGPMTVASLLANVVIAAELQSLK